MTNKIQKIREGIEKLKSNLIHGACSSQVAMETRCKEEAYNEMLAILDSMQEEPVSEDSEETSGLNMQRAQDFIEGYHQAKKDLLENKHETSWRLDKKLWSGIKDVEEASYQYMYDASNDWAYDIPTWKDVQDAFKAGSEWKEGLELTWEDMRELHIIFTEVDVEIELGKIDIKTETLGYYEEVLSRFNKKKEK